MRDLFWELWHGGSTRLSRECCYIRPVVYILSIKSSFSASRLAGVERLLF